MSYALGEVAAPAPRPGYVWVPAKGSTPAHWERAKAAVATVAGHIITPEEKAAKTAQAEAIAAGLLPMPTPGTPGAAMTAPKKSPLLLYGGMAAGLVVLFLILRKKKTHE